MERIKPSPPLHSLQWPVFFTSSFRLISTGHQASQRIIYWGKKQRRFPVFLPFWGLSSLDDPPERSSRPVWPVSVTMGNACSASALVARAPGVLLGCTMVQPSWTLSASCAPVVVWGEHRKGLQYEVHTAMGFQHDCILKGGFSVKWMHVRSIT